ncbi:MAG: NHL repeat-containing protein [bacterium]|nr:NHL repeat-containing protein [bacterium]
MATGRRRLAALVTVAVLTAAFVLVSGCGPALQGGAGGDARDDVQRGVGSRPVGLNFLTAYENVPGASYFPLDGIAGCAFGPDGTLLVCDEKRGRVHALDPRDLSWYEFDEPASRPYQPLDAVYDGLKVLVLDRAGVAVQRFEPGGAWLDELADLRQLDPGDQPLATSLAIDRDGRLLIGDAASQQVLLLDTFLALHLRVGGPGTVSDQFRDPSGVAFLADGGFVVADRGNRRLCRYGRNGFFEGTVGGDFEVDNPFVAPQGLDTDRFGNLFVADPGAGRIHALDHRLRLLFSAGPDMSLQAAPSVPVDVAVGPDGTLAVTDRARAAVLVYRILYE